MRKKGISKQRISVYKILIGYLNDNCKILGVICPKEKVLIACQATCLPHLLFDFYQEGYLLMEIKCNVGVKILRLAVEVRS